MLTFVRGVAWLAAAAWLGLLVARGRFWDATADRLAEPAPEGPLPDIVAIVPARNEGDVIERSLGSLLAQDYRGRFTIAVVDDRSEDATADVVRAVSAGNTAPREVALIGARPRPDGWTGKLWALSEGVAVAGERWPKPAYWWFTDADIEHAPDTLSRLVATARAQRRELVSLMVELHCATAWERLLIPAFVFFFRMLYPFAWVNDPARATAGAAGGCVLLDANMLTRIGGLREIRGALIDDCSLALAVQRAGGRLFLALTTRSRSIRPYGGLEPIWSMVARTAYTQLNYSPALLAGTVAGMLVLYVAPLAALALGIARRRPLTALGGALALATMAHAYWPTVRLYSLPKWRAFTLPLAGMLYTAMTLDSAYRHGRGRGGTWKGRHFTPSAPTR
jgi:hopene-associated glycosyltransferase HpnB